jgi:hypothetical protein
MGSVGLSSWDRCNALCRQQRAGDELGEAPQVLGNGGEGKFVLCATWTTESEATEPQDALEVREPHLDTFAIAPRMLECLGAGERSGHVAGMLVDVAWDLACGFFRAASRLE